MKAASGWIRVAAIGFLLAVAPVKAGAITLTPQAKHNISNNFTPEFYEASGLCIAKNESKLWSVGDENNFAMYKMELDGAAVSNNTASPATSVTIQFASFEGVTYAPPPPGIGDDHYIYLVDENSSSVVPVNYNTDQYRAPIPLSGMAGYSWSSAGAAARRSRRLSARRATAGSRGSPGTTTCRASSCSRRRTPGS